MRIFVCEFITGGGLYRELLPSSLSQEGALMRDALLRDLAALPGIHTSVTCDARLPMPALAHASQPVSAQDDVWALWQRGMVEADAVWLVAPESGGTLTRLTQMAEALGKPVLGCNAAAVALAADKLACSDWLQARGVHSIPGYTPAQWLSQRPTTPHGWVAKPRDGAGCEDSGYFADETALQAWIAPRLHSHVIQPYQPGSAASLSLLCRHGQAWLLSFNRQLVELQDQAFHYRGSELNAMAAHWHAGAALAASVAAAMPGLAGYVGVDVIVDSAGQLYLLEVNPRLTTSYAGLHAAIDCNPAQLVLDLLLYNDEHFVLPALARHTVAVALKAG